MLQFNLAGNAMHGGSLDVAEATRRSVATHRPQLISLNEVCLGQFQALQKGLRPQYRGVFMRQAACKNGQPYGVALFTGGAWVGAPDEALLPTAPRAEQRVMLCRKTRFSRDGRGTLACTAHFEPGKWLIEGVLAKKAQAREVANLLRPRAKAGEALILGGDLYLDATAILTVLGRNQVAVTVRGSTWCNPRVRRDLKSKLPDNCVRRARSQQFDHVIVARRRFTSGLSGRTLRSAWSDHLPVVGEARLSASASAPPLEATPLYRLWQRSSGDHFYTTSVRERSDAIIRAGYRNEGVTAYVFPSRERGTTPLYRLWQRRTGDHFYTTSPGERQNAIAKAGYVDEGIRAYVYARRRTGTVALYRLWHPRTGDHFYTTSSRDRRKAARAGYLDEGIRAYVLPARPR